LLTFYSEGFVRKAYAAHYIPTRPCLSLARFDDRGMRSPPLWSAF
jgi:hypothetical protein